jgi:hypothetical protein
MHPKIQRGALQLIPVPRPSGESAPLFPNPKAAQRPGIERI